jgi:hypothetical protein
MTATWFAHVTVAFIKWKTNFVNSWLQPEHHREGGWNILLMNMQDAARVSHESNLSRMVCCCQFFKIARLITPSSATASRALDNFAATSSELAPQSPRLLHCRS